jgi:hypothetical protein
MKKPSLVVPSLLSIGSDAKTVKGESVGYQTGIMYLAPAKESGAIDVCSHASDGCRDACIFKTGRGQMPAVIESRVNRTLLFHQHRTGFLCKLADEITSLVKRAERRGMKPAVRLNGTSDLPWESIRLNGKNIMEHYPNVQFYDYTKNPARAWAHAAGQMSGNYHLTFSRSETNEADAREILRAGGNVSVVFGGTLPKRWAGKKVIDGDKNDLRFLDPRGVVVGLIAKGPGRKDKSGFVVEGAK